MIKDTKQQNFWQSDFGKGYSDRNTFSPDDLDQYYQTTYGLTRSDLNNRFLAGLSLQKILEIGCNVGNQLRLLQKQGYGELFGIDIRDDAVVRARQLTGNPNLIQGSALEVPFPDNAFDLVFTSGVLIHISPEDIKTALAEIHRLSKKYIWGFEYYSEQYQEIEYRGNHNCLWKADFSKMFLDNFPDLKVLKAEKYPYLTDSSKLDMMFLLVKT